MIRKIMFFLMAAFVGIVATSSLSSCSDDDSDSTAEIAQSLADANKIKFNVDYDGIKGTRALLDSAGTDSVLPQFYISSYLPNGACFFGGETTPLIYTYAGWVDKGKDKSYALYDNPGTYYWPNATTASDSSLNFIATNYPIPADTTNFHFYFNAGNPYFYVFTDNLTTSSNPGQRDWMIASALNQTRKTHNGIVELRFKHIYSNVQICIDNSSIKDNWELSTDGSGSYEIRNIKDGGRYYLKTNTWTLFPYNSAMHHYDDELLPTGAGVQNWINFYAVPQALASWKSGVKPGENPGTYICISGLTLKDKTTGRYLLGSEDYGGTIYIPISGTWEQGKRYRYILKFNGKGGGGVIDENGNPILNVISYQVKAEGWDDSDNNIGI